MGGPLIAAAGIIVFDLNPEPRAAAQTVIALCITYNKPHSLTAIHVKQVEMIVQSS